MGILKRPNGSIDVEATIYQLAGDINIMREDMKWVKLLVRIILGFIVAIAIRVFYPL